MALWVISAVINTAAVVMSIELNSFDWWSYLNLSCMAVSFFYIGAKA